MKERMNELIDIINQADYEYHTLDNPSITDQEYDKYLRELFEIEEAHPDWVREEDNESAIVVIAVYCQEVK